LTEEQILIKEYETDNTKHKWDHKKIKLLHEISVEYKYKKRENQKGYTTRILYDNLSAGEIKEKKVTEEMEKKFTEDCGFAESTDIEFILLSRKKDDGFNSLDKVVDYLLSILKYYKN
jgi:hypothetical protein